MIVITGATGQLGRAVVKQLLARMPADQIVAATRDPTKGQDLAALGVHVRRADFTDASSLAKAFTGAEQVLVVSVDKLGDAATRMHRTAIEAAQAARARRVLYTSHMGTRADSPFAPGADHAASEAFLAAGTGPFTSLRHGFYAESAWQLVGHGLQAGELRTPQDGPVSWTARADLAEADALVIAKEGPLDGITPPLTGTEAFTMADLAALASELTGRYVKHVTVPDDQWLTTTVSHGVPAPMAEMLLGMYQAARRGDFARVDPALAQLLGRPPQSMRDFFAAKLTTPPTAAPSSH